METKLNEIEINGIKYVKKDNLQKMASDIDGLKYCIVRTYSAGVFAGYVKERNGKEATLLQARRLWRWAGAATLSQLAMEGTKTPNDCKFPIEVTSVELTEVIEVIQCTEAAQHSISEVPIWTA